MCRESREQKPHLLMSQIVKPKMEEQKGVISRYRPHGQTQKTDQNMTEEMGEKSGDNSVGEHNLWHN